MKLSGALLCGAGLFATVAGAGAEEWRLVPAASRLGFSASVEGAAVAGEFKAFSAVLAFAPDAAASARLRVAVDTASADLHEPDMNAAVAAPAWLDVRTHPTAEFAAPVIERLGDETFVARGRLRLKGVEQALEVPFTWQVIERRASMVGEFALSRTAFGVGTGEWGGTDVVGDRVTVHFELAFDAAQ